MRLRKKIMVVVAVISTFGCLAMWFGLATPAMGVLYEKNNGLIETSINQLASQCEELLSSVETTSYTFLGLDNLYDALIQSATRQYSSGFTQQIADLRTLTTHYLTRPSIYSVAFYDAKGDVLFQAINSITDDNCQAWLQAARRKDAGIVWSGAYASQNLTALRTDIPVISLFRPIVSPGSYLLVGSMRITMLEESLNNLLETGRVHLSKAVMLCDRAGRVLSSEDKSLLGGTIDYFDTEIAPDAQGLISYERGDERIFARRIGDYDLYVVEMLPANYLEQLTHSLWNYSLMILLAMWVGMLIYAWFTSRMLAKPVNTLVGQMHEVEKGNLDTQIGAIAQDEIGLISSSFNRMVQSLKASQEALIKSRLKVHQMRLQTLRLQLNPHFLLNTLDNIRWIALGQGNAAINDYIESFSAILKNTLSQQRVSTVRHEIQLAKRYFALERLRFGENLTLDFAVGDFLLDCLMPTFVLQPILENTMTHGFPRKEADNSVFIVIEQSGADLVIDITDNGVGADEEEVRQVIAGKRRDRVSILNNIDARIHLDFGEDYHGGVQFFSKAGMGTRVVVTLPFDKSAYRALLRAEAQSEG